MIEAVWLMFNVEKLPWINVGENSKPVSSPKNIPNPSKQKPMVWSLCVFRKDGFAWKKKNAWECTRQSWGHHIIQLQSPHSILLALLPFQWLYHLHPCSKLLSILFRFTWNEESFSSCSQEGSAKSPQGPTLTLTSMTLTLTSFSFIFTFPLIRLRLSIVCSNQQIQHFLWKWVCSFSKDSRTSVVNIGILPS